MQRYINIAESNTKTNNECTEEAINYIQPIDVYLKIIDNTVQFSVYGNKPFTSEKITQTGYCAINASG